MLKTAAAAASERIVHTFAKNGREEVRVSLASYRGRDLVSVRAYYLGSDQEFHPSPKGITFARELLPELEVGVAALRAAVDAAATTVTP